MKPCPARRSLAMRFPADAATRASAEELQTLPGIGPKLAERIIANRPYQKVDDLLKVRGIGTNNFERFRARVRTE